MDRPGGVAPSFRLDDRVAVVIGGTGVLGRRIAGALAGAGARTVAVGRDEAKGEETTAALAGLDGDVAFERCDATRRAELAALVGRLQASHGRIDVLVNAAGVNSGTPFLEITDEELERIVATDQLAVVRACQEFGRYFVARATGEGVGASIVTVGSTAATAPLSKVFTYAMAKAAVHNLTRNLAREWGPLGIRCNVLVPGFFPAEQNRALLDQSRVEAIVDHTPLGRLGVPDDLVGAVLLLASDAGRFVTGAEIVVDGGFGVAGI
ncbi:MAG: SDR family oxidoreductase [Acidobacteriota bacterium]|nr:SDR family oxidoreductase [Acidobacteriota bacterium]